ncbi:hypothetical protein AB4Y33_43170, partial [Paraburkholderia sp. BR14319]|uniref:hypothetical protein n=1 Tax=Paraburkholderia sp. BR14319 TaxID=3237005 RepID=UPI0034D1E9DD
ANGDVSMAGTAAQQKVSVQSGGSVTLAGSHIGITGYSIAANGLQVNAGRNVALNDVQAGGAFAVTAATGNATFNGNAAAVG